MDSKVFARTIHYLLILLLTVNFSSYQAIVKSYDQAAIVMQLPAVNNREKY
ncbi:MAG: hypothetical protein M3040_09315 [Bacteroidota bacterium]|nr:hypothetical protein [Bacteroidota bacterium]